MGYDLYITRKRSWSDVANLIAVEEWHRIIESDPKLVPAPDDPRSAYFADSELDWLTWKRGTIFAKTASLRMIDEMARIASALNAQVLGDDGEVYQGNGVVIPAPAPSLWERVRIWWENRSTAPLQPVETPFQVGDRVREIFGDQNVATVAKVDVRANNGLGSIVIHYDDGRVGNWFCVGHGLVLLDDAPRTSVDGTLHEPSS